MNYDGSLRCSNCGKKLGEHLQGKIEIVCPRCHFFEVFTLPPAPCGTCFANTLTKEISYASLEIKKI